MNTTTILGTLASEMTAPAVSRRDAVLRTGKVAGALALATLPLSLGVMTRKAFAQGPITPEQLTALNFALKLERLEASFYAQALASGLDFGDTRPIFEQISKHEAAHVLVLETVLAASAAPVPTFDFGNAFSSLDTFVTMAQGFEDLGVRAYKGQVETLATSAELLSVALRIHSVEARHAAMVRRLPQSPAAKGWITGNEGATGDLAPVYDGEEVSFQFVVDVQQFGPPDAATEAFDEPLESGAVDAIIGPFIGPPAPPPET
jgi:rubrerythrin